MKKLIVLATLAALPAAAMADVTISGLVGVAVTNVKTGNAGSVNNMASQEGEVDFSGSEDLGNGLKAIWKYSHVFNTDNRDAATSNYETYIGLTGGFGRVQLGGTDNAVREIGAAGLADLPTVFGVHTTTTEDAIYKSSRKRLKDGITYVAPTFGGLTVAVSHGMKTADNNETSTTSGTVSATDGDGNPFTADVSGTTTDGTQYATSLAAKYVVNDMFTVSYASNFTKKQSTNKTDRAQEINARGSFGDFGLNVGYAWNKSYESASSSSKQHAVAVSGSYSLGAATLIAGWYKQSDSKLDGVNQQDGYKNYTLGADYALSKRTNVGVEWSKEDRRGSDNDVRGFATYIYHAF